MVDSGSGRGGGRANNQMDIASENPVSTRDKSRRIRGARYDTDGGVRLAGGRLEEAMVDELADQRSNASHSDGSTLPPPYSSHFGDTE